VNTAAEKVPGESGLHCYGGKIDRKRSSSEMECTYDPRSISFDVLVWQPWGLKVWDPKLIPWADG